MDKLDEFESYLQDYKLIFEEDGYRFERKPRFSDGLRKLVEETGKNPGECIIISDPHGKQIFRASFGFDTLGKLKVDSDVCHEVHGYYGPYSAADIFWATFYRFLYPEAFDEA